jgi:integrase/recombinase XerD
MGIFIDTSPSCHDAGNQSSKVIAGFCGISTPLTFHLARHTFAATATLQNGVPMETISKLLGHTKLTTTMMYARVLEEKIGAGMRALQGRLNERKGSGHDLC